MMMKKTQATIMSKKRVTIFLIIYKKPCLICIDDYNIDIKDISNTTETSVPINQTDFSPNPMYTFDRQTPLTRSARETRQINAPLLRSKTPGPEVDGTKSSSYRSNTMKPRSKTPTANEFSSNNLHNRFKNKFHAYFHLNTSFLSSRSLQSVHPQYFELVVNLTLLRPK